MTGEQFIRFSISKLENKLFETRKELAELKAELAELKQVINKLPSRNSACLVNELYNAIELVKAFAQARELK